MFKKLLAHDIHHSCRGTWLEPLPGENMQKKQRAIVLSIVPAEEIAQEVAYVQGYDPL